MTNLNKIENEYIAHKKIVSPYKVQQCTVYVYGLFLDLWRIEKNPRYPVSFNKKIRRI